MLKVDTKHRPAVIQHSTLNIQHSTFAVLRAFIVCAFITTTAFAQLSSFGGASNIPGQELVKLTGAVNERHATQVKGVVTATIEDGWHINSNKPLDDFVIPTKLTFEGTELISAEYPQHTVRSFTFSGGQKLAV